MTGPKIPKGWKKTTLGEVAEIIGGGTPKTDVPEFWDGIIPWLSVVDFNYDNRWVTKTDKTITEQGLKNSSTNMLEAGDLIVSARGTVGAFAQLKVPMAFNQSCYGLRANEISENDFLYYLLKHNIQQLKQNVHGAVFDTITRDTFDQVDVLLPPLPEQRAIAGVLSSLDDKIELLREQNKTLEATAQAIFKRWFIDFEFPDAKGHPYKSSGGKMIPSSLGHIPAGWRVGKLGDEFEIIMGQSPDGSSYNESNDGMIFFQGRAEFKDRFPNTRLYTTEPKRIAEKFDVLVSVRAPVGDINVAFDKCCIGRGLGAVRCKNKSYALYKIQSLREIFNKFEAEGTVFGSINKESFANIAVIIPEGKMINMAETVLNPLDLKIFDNFIQIQTLSALRDTLLPKLMKGELSTMQVL